MTDALVDLLALLDIEAIEVNVFRGANTDEDRQRVFGGQVAAQGLVAAGRTVERGTVHSLHSYFLRPGDPGAPILYEVDRIRDGKSFLTRRVVAIQHGRAIFNLQCSFHTYEEGIVHQFPMPNVPDPESLLTVEERLEPFREQMEGWFFDRPRPIDQRFIGDLPWLRNRDQKDSCQQLWLRTDGKMPDDPLMHAAVMAYASDMTLYDSILQPHQIRWQDEQFMGASLDHCMWFHRPFRVDEWLLFDQDSPSAYGARGIARGLLFTRAGDLAMSVVQEGLIRMRQPAAPLGPPGETAAPVEPAGESPDSLIDQDAPSTGPLSPRAR
ncbi:MAG: acyl-CoA thioesterase [Acidimicrobiales bacterium]